MSVLIWFSGKEEKHLKLSHVSRIISGQRTVSLFVNKASVLSIFALLLLYYKVGMWLVHDRWTVGVSLIALAP